MYGYKVDALEEAVTGAWNGLEAHSTERAIWLRQVLRRHIVPQATPSKG
jgi:hypothetical protein